MSKFLNLYNTFTRTLKTVQLNGQLIEASSIGRPLVPLNGSFYICGPTVYSGCHVGHALNYIRADLFRRFMKSIFNVRLTTVMNITDIDDKILDRTRIEFSKESKAFPSDPERHPFREISNKYYKSFLDDMTTLNVEPADFYIKISQHINLIVDFIGKLEKDGFAYITESGDVRFRVKSLKSYTGRLDNRETTIKAAVSVDELDDERDFVLWKSAKPDEPVWYYRSSTRPDKLLPGRPGWHVQCSAIASALFGNKLDFHFGGKDLIFPHHYNEEACCCAYHNLDTTSSLHVWSNNWLHSGHLVLSDRKMSKSLGNVVPIKSFINQSSINALRLLCISTHYRSNVEFDENLMSKLKQLDHRISAFVSFLHEELLKVQEDLTGSEVCDRDSEEISHLVSSTQQQIIEGICDDFHLDKGLDSILMLTKTIYAMQGRSLKVKDLLSIWYLVKDWCDTCGLSYGPHKASFHDNISRDLLVEFRQKIRHLTLNEVKSGKGAQLHKNLLNECDTVRSKMDSHGFVVRDN